MKRFGPVLLLVVALTLIATPFAFAAASKSSSSRGGASPAVPIAAAISTVTGIAISPLLGTGVYGFYQWWNTEGEAARAELPWYSQPEFWIPALLIVALVAAKDALGASVPPGWKKPLDVLETIENKWSGLIAAGAVVPFAMDSLSKLLIGSETAGAEVVLAPTGLAMIHFAAFDPSWLLNVLTIPFGVAVFLVVWMASHAINVLILLSPWGAIDAALKAARTSLIALIAATTAINPWVGALLSIAVIIVAYFVAGWAFRLTVFGSLFCWDFLTRGRLRFTPRPDGNRMFAGPHLAGVPVRSYGRLGKRADGALEFAYRPWLVLAERRMELPVPAASVAVDRGLFTSDIAAADGRTLFLLPPRYCGHEEELASAYELGGGVRPAGLRRAWSELRELVGGRALTAQPA